MADNVPEQDTPYFCYQCLTQNNRVTADLRCSECNSDFIEFSDETGRESAAEQERFGSGTEINDRILAEIAQQVGANVIQPMINASSSSSFPSTSAASNIDSSEVYHGFGPVGIQATGFNGQLWNDLMMQMSGQTLGEGGSIPNMPHVQVLENLIPQIFGALDDASEISHPMRQDAIDQIPRIKISEEQLATKEHCSVCWEDYTLDEEVRKLHCEHCFHDSCIVPWLKLHSTCPVCRKSQIPEGSSQSNRAERNIWQPIVSDGASQWILSDLGRRWDNQSQPPTPFGVSVGDGSFQSIISNAIQLYRDGNMPSNTSTTNSSSEGVSSSVFTSAPTVGTSNASSSSQGEPFLENPSGGTSTYQDDEELE